MIDPSDLKAPITRRVLLRGLAALGVGSATFHRALAARAADEGKVTPEMIQQAEWISGLELTDAEREDTAKNVQASLAKFQALRKVKVDYDVAPCLAFVPDPALAMAPAPPVRRNQAVATETHAPKRPDTDEALAFLPVTELSALIRDRQVTSTELTKLYLKLKDLLQVFKLPRSHFPVIT